jgi:hypothetical protein
MAEKLFDRLLTVVGILTGLGFLGLAVYVEISHGGLTLRKFAVAWSVLYVFAVTLGFKGNLETHKDRLRGFVVEWVIACLVGLLLGVAVFIVG